MANPTLRVNTQAPTLKGVEPYWTTKRYRFDRPTETLLEVLLLNNPSINVHRLPTPKIDLLELSDFLAQGANPRVTSTARSSALHLSLVFNSDLMVDMLVKYGADVNALNHEGLTPLMVAVKNRNIIAMKRLIMNGANVNHRGKDGETALHFAAQQEDHPMGYLAIMKMLLYLGAKPNLKTLKGETPLGIASRRNQVEMARLLLQYGAEINCKTINLFTALHLSVNYGALETLVLLIDCGANLDARAQRGLTAMHVAISRRDDLMARMMVWKGANIDDPSYCYLHDACRYACEIHTVALFMSQDDRELNYRDPQLNVPLHHAVLSKDAELVQFLLNCGADMNLANADHFTPLELALNSETETAVTDVLVEHVIKLLHLRFPVSEGNQNCMRNYDQEKVETYYNRCRAELRYMRGHNVSYDHVFNFEELFTQPFNRMVTLLRKANVRERVVSQNFCIGFPVFGHFITARIRMMEKAARLRYKLSRFCATIFVGELFLPTEIIHDICDNFDEEEIRAILPDTTLVFRQ